MSDAMTAARPRPARIGKVAQMAHRAAALANPLPSPARLDARQACALRAAFGLPLTRVADEVGISRESLMNFELSKHVMRRSLVERLEQYYEQLPGVILTDDCLIIQKGVRPIVP